MKEVLRDFVRPPSLQPPPLPLPANTYLLIIICDFGSAHVNVLAFVFEICFQIEFDNTIKFYEENKNCVRKLNNKRKKVIQSQHKLGDIKNISRNQIEKRDRERRKNNLDFSGVE